MANFLRCYKMTYDTEFAPNPHHGVLTLATCKPVIRRCAEEGDWIAGWTANEVHDKFGNIHSFRGEQKLIYLARITKKLTLGEYWEKYPQKRPESAVAGNTGEKKGCGGTHEVAVSSAQVDHGDNIYKPDGKNGLIQVKNSNHGDPEMKRDISGVYALICKEFYYFGVEHALSVEKNLFDYVVPRYKKIPLSDVRKFIDCVKECNQVRISSKNLK